MQSSIFRRLVAAGSVKQLTFAITGITDTAIVGTFMGMDGLAAMKIAMPVFSVLYLFSTVLGSGQSVILSEELSQNGIRSAERVFRSVLTATVMLSAVMMLTGIIAPEAVARIFAAGNADPGLIRDAACYIAPVLIGTLPVIAYEVLGNVVLLEGDDRCMAVSSVAILVIDVLGDIIAVMLKAGITGIAVASVAAYTGALLVTARHFFGSNSMFRPGLSAGGAGDTVRAAAAGMPMGLSYLCYLIWPVAFNYLMIRYGSVSGLAALSVQDSVRYFPMALCAGIEGAALILTGMFSAEQDEKALSRERRDILKWCFIGGTAAAAVFAASAPAIICLFSDDRALHDESLRAVLLYLPGVPFLAFNSSAAAYLQGMGRKLDAGICVQLNHLVLPLICGGVLAEKYGAYGIYAAFPACEIIMTLLIAAAVFILYAGGMDNARAKLFGSWPGIRAEMRRSISSSEQAAAVSEEAAQFCIQNGAGTVQAQHIALCIEELAVNSIEHGFTDGKNHHLEMRMIIGQEELILRLRDDCRRFDLTERYKMINPDDPASGIGLRIVFASADDVSYSSALDLNNVCIRIGTGKVLYGENDM
jgi:Na+-driven multidrug efflux pump/anti-sigma regulatory factor (Ser/Thr protein kinase)